MALPDDFRIATAGSLAQAQRGQMQQFAGEPVCQGLEHLFGGLAGIELPACLIQRILALTLGVLAVTPDGADGIQRPDPVHESIGLVGDEAFRLIRGRCPRAPVAVDHVTQVIHSVQIDIGQILDAGLDVAGYRQVGHEHRAVSPCPEALAHGLAAEDGLGAPRAGDHDVCIGKKVLHLVQAEGTTAAQPGHHFGAIPAAVGHHQSAHALFPEVPGGELDHLAGADQQGLALAQVAKDLAGQGDGGEGHRDRMRADIGLGAYSLGDREGMLEEPIEDLSEQAGPGRGVIGHLGLSEYLWLTEHQRIETRGDSQQMDDGVAGLECVQIGAQPVVLQPVLALQPALKDGRRRLGCEHRIDLRAVAGGEYGGLAHTGSLGECSQGIVQAFGRENHPLPHGKRRRLVIEAQADDRHWDPVDWNVADCRAAPLQHKYSKALMSRFANSNPPRPRSIRRPGARIAPLLPVWLLTACVPMAGNDVPVAERADTRLVAPAEPVVVAVESPMHRVMAAELAAVRGNVDRASALYAEVADQLRDPEVMARAVQLALRAQQPARAIRLAERWVALAPERIDAKQLLGVMQLRAGQTREATRILIESLPSPGPEREAAIARLGGLLLDGSLPPDTLDVMRAVVRAAPRSGAARLALARVALTRGEPGIALAAVDQALAQRPGWVSARLLRADVLLALQRPDEAVGIFEDLLVSSPDNRALRRDYARTLLQLGRESEALAQYRDLVTAGATHPQLLSTAAILAMQAGEDALALEALRRLRRANPGFRARSLLLEGGLLRRDGQLAESLAVFDRAVGDYPDHLELRYGRAMTRIMNADIEGGEADLRRILRSHPDDARALNALGYTLVDQTDRVAEGAALIERAYAINPDDPAIIDSMGWAAYRAGDAERALGYLRRAHERSGGNAEIAAHLGEVLWVLGRREAARAIWAEAEDADADHSVLQETRERLDP